jgi:dTDP-4-dehydrorhamnose 3,5-epimerase
MSSPFQIQAAPLPGVRVLEPRGFSDERGDFVKTYHESAWRDAGIEFPMREEYYSRSHRGVLRGMHFQVPPADHAKVVYCASGRVRDVLLDLRRSSPAFGQGFALELSAANRLVLVIPAGVAHGFLALEDHSLMVYKTSTTHSPAHDAGIRWDSFGFDWNWPDPIVSPRDMGFPPLAAFTSPFA